MPTSIFGSLNTALRALQTMQTAIQTVGHNTANAATPGYSRQRVVFTTSEPYTLPTHYRDTSAGQVGTGVMASTVRRYRSAFLDSQIREQTWGLSGWETRQDILRQTEVIMNEPSDTGLSTYMSNFWSAWQDLAASPDSSAAHAYVAETAAELASSLRTSHEQLHSLQSDLNDRVDMQVTQVNALAHRIADLNKSISHVEALGQQPNDLRDERDKVMEELSKMLNVNTGETDAGSYWVSTGGRMLVYDQTVKEMKTELDSANSQLFKVVWAQDGETVSVKGEPLDANMSSNAGKVLAGEFGATFLARDLIAKGKMQELDEVANTFISAVNALHQTGFDMQGNSTAGEDFFIGTGAGDIKVSDYIANDYTHVATAGAANSPGDGSVALALYQLSDEKLMNGGTTSIHDYYRAIIGNLGQDARHAAVMTENHQQLVNHLQNRQDQISGVSLDEEAMQMLQYQRTYQAAARIMTTADEMLDRVINNMGLVGR